MGISKTEGFTSEQNEMSSLFKVLGHPARIAIIQYLMSVDACICGDIVEELPLAQPTVSQHLKELKNAGIIQGTIEGKGICYCVNPKKIQLMSQFLEQVIIKKSNQKTCC
jgi:DNA-binding transcriptional ArsR family regulator